MMPFDTCCLKGTQGFCRLNSKSTDQRRQAAQGSGKKADHDSLKNHPNGQGKRNETTDRIASDFNRTANVQKQGR